MRATFSVHLVPDFITLTTFCALYSSCSSSLCSVLLLPPSCAQIPPLRWSHWSRTGRNRVFAKHVPVLESSEVLTTVSVTITIFKDFTPFQRNQNARCYIIELTSLHSLCTAVCLDYTPHTSVGEVAATARRDVYLLPNRIRALFVVACLSRCFSAKERQKFQLDSVSVLCAWLYSGL